MLSSLLTLCLAAEPVSLGPLDLQPCATVYLVADGRPVEVTLRLTQAGRDPSRAMIRLLDPAETVVWRRYLEYVPEADRLPGLDRDIDLRDVARPPAAGETVLEQTWRLETPGVHQLRLVDGARGARATVTLSRPLDYGLGFQNGRTRPWAGAVREAFLFIPPRAEQVTLVGGPLTLADETGRELGRTDKSGRLEAPVARSGAVWRLTFPEPNWEFRASGCPIILCPSPAAARSVGGSVVELPDGTVVCHRFQARIHEALPRLLAPERVRDAEQLIVPLSARRAAWLADPFRSLVLRDSFLPTVEGWLKSQNVDPASHWSGAMDGWRERTDRRWDTLRAVEGLWGGASTRDSAEAAHALALAATIDEPTNPYHGRSELLYRAAAAALRDLMVVDEACVFPGVADLDDYPGQMAFVLGQKTLPVFAVAAPQLPADVRRLWSEALEPIIARSLTDPLTSARNQSSHYLVAYEAYGQGSGDPFYRGLAKVFARRWVRGESPAGYHMEATGPCASYIGMTHWHEAVYYRLSGDESVLDSLRRTYRFFGHTIAPEPDGRLLGGFNFGHRVGEGFYGEQWSGAKGILADVLPEVGRHAGAPPTEADRAAAVTALNQFLDDPKPPLYAGLTTPRYLWFGEPDRSLSWPCREATSFIRRFADELVAVKRPGYYAVIYTGRPAAGEFYIRGREAFRTPFAGDLERTGGNLPDMRRITPYVGGGLTGFWTPDYGHSVMAANWSPTTHHGLTATIDGKRFWEDYFGHTHRLDEAAGALTVDGKIETQPLTYRRAYAFGDRELTVDLTVTATTAVELTSLVETIPVARGGWKAAGATLTAGGRTSGVVVADRFTITDREGRGVEALFDQPVTLELIPEGLKAGGWRQLQFGRVEVGLPARWSAGQETRLRYVLRPL